MNTELASLPDMKFSMLRIALIKIFVSGNQCSLHPSSKTSTTENSFLTLLIHDFDPRDFEK